MNMMEFIREKNGYNLTGLLEELNSEKAELEFVVRI